VERGEDERKGERDEGGVFGGQAQFRPARVLFFFFFFFTSDIMTDAISLRAEVTWMNSDMATRNNLCVFESASFHTCAQ